MTSIPDIQTVRSLLDRDRIWAVYALGDLDPRRAGFCRWHVHNGSVALLYQEFDTPILFAAGADPAVLEFCAPPDGCYLQIPKHFEVAVRDRFCLQWTRPMARMGLDRTGFRPDGPPLPEGAELERLVASDEGAIRELYADGKETGEDPDFFMRSQLHDGTFYGVRAHGRLVAAGGTHLYSEPESVAAIGNIYTHRAHRGRGYARAVTAAITQTMLERNIDTIALNVKSQNAAAIRIYEQLGFHFHCTYWEGLASNIKTL